MPETPKGAGRRSQGRAAPMRGARALDETSETSEPILAVLVVVVGGVLAIHEPWSCASGGCGANASQAVPGL